MQMTPHLLLITILEWNVILHRVDVVGRTAGLTLNAKKTKVRPTLSPDQLVYTDIKVGNTSLDKVNEFKYFRSFKTNNGTCSKDIKLRITMAKYKMLQLKTILIDHILTTHLKMKMLECLVWTVMLYGRENWSAEQLSFGSTAPYWKFAGKARNQMKHSWRTKLRKKNTVKVCRTCNKKWKDKPNEDSLARKNSRQKKERTTRKFTDG